jgi:hypothetical protein
VVGEADAIAEQRAACEGAGGVDREHGDLAFGLAHLRGQRTDQRALADPGRTGEADDARPAGAREHLPDQLPALRIVVLDQSDRPGKSPLVAGDQALGEALLGLLGHRPSLGTEAEPRIAAHAPSAPVLPP